MPLGPFHHGNGISLSLLTTKRKIQESAYPGQWMIVLASSSPTFQMKTVLGDRVLDRPYTYPTGLNQSLSYFSASPTGSRAVPMDPRTLAGR